MACGVCLGIVLMCLVQAEHVSCSQASHGESSRRLDGNVGFLQQDRLRRLDRRYPQDQFRQASGFPRSSQGSSLKQASNGYSQRFPSGGNTQTVTRPSQVTRLFLRLNKPAVKPEVKAPLPPKKKFQLSTAIASGSSLSGMRLGKNNPTDDVKRRQSVQGLSQTAQRPSSALTPETSYYSSKPAQNPSAGSHAFNKPKGTSEQAVAPVQAKTSASSPGRKVYLEYRPSGSQYPSAIGYNWIKSKNGQPAQNAKPSYSSVMQSPIRRTPTRGAQDLESGSSLGGTKRFAPTKTVKIPYRFGGAVIKRLAKPDKSKPAPVKKPQQISSTPQQVAAQPRGQAPRLRGDAKWAKARVL